MDILNRVSPEIEQQQQPSALQAQASDHLSSRPQDLMPVKPEDTATSWLKEFAIDEGITGGTGAVLGAAGLYGLGKLVGPAANAWFAMGSRGGLTYSAESLGDVSLGMAKLGGVAGLSLGLAAGAVGFGLYEGYEWLTKDKNNHST